MYLMYIICKYKDIHPSLDISVDMGCILSATKSHYKTPILYFSIGWNQSGIISKKNNPKNANHGEKKENNTKNCNKFDPSNIP